jgi:putative transposase
MPQSLCQIYVHLIFSTRHRESLLDAAIRSRVHAYLAEVARGHGCPFVVAGGTDDHAHLLLDLGKQVTPPALVETVKKESSKFVKTLGVQYAQFYWQRGYGMFSVGPTQRTAVQRYIESQEEHHRRRTFQEEFRAFLDRYGIAYDERYVWD